MEEVAVDDTHHRGGGKNGIYGHLCNLWQIALSSFFRNLEFASKAQNKILWTNLSI